VQVVLALHLLQHAQHHLLPHYHHHVQVVLALHLLQHAQHHLPPRHQQPTSEQGQQQHGACLATNRAHHDDGTSQSGADRKQGAGH
jgi:hypothetical protein